MNEPKWYLADAPAGRDYPEWQRMAAVIDGAVFVPAGCLGPEQAVADHAWARGQMVIYADDHPYVPLAWVRRQLDAEEAVIMNEIEERVLKVAALELMDAGQVGFSFPQ